MMIRLVTTLVILQVTLKVFQNDMTALEIKNFYQPRDEKFADEELIGFHIMVIIQYLEKNKPLIQEILHVINEKGNLLCMWLINRKLSLKSSREKNAYKTGGGTFVPQSTHLDTKIVSVLGPQFKPLVNKFDSSANFIDVQPSCSSTSIQENDYIEDVTGESIDVFNTEECIENATINDVSGLRDIHIKVPEAVRVGDTVTLSCDYDLEQVALYTIKWYRYDLEFYRYVPKESPPSKVFPMAHISVDISRSNSTEVTLTEVDRETSGEFKCEVSADAPLFHTEIRSANLLVADIPDEGPVLRTEVQKVTPGAKIKANCTTPGSYPPMNVSWFINDVEIHPKNGVKIQESVLRYEALPGLETVHSTITMKALPDLFKNGKMKLRCLATMYTLYRRTKETELQEDAPLLALIMVPVTHSNDGINKGSRKSHHYVFQIFATTYAIHSTLRYVCH